VTLFFARVPRAAGGADRAMSSTTMLLMGRVAATALIAQVGWASTSGASREGDEANQSQARPTRTGKERLGGKPSDDQRIDNCNVPPDLRGSKPRPDGCGDGVSTSSER
jgi:hypothetical protein